MGRRQQPGAAGERELADYGITVVPNGPYLVRGGVRLVVKSPALSEHGEPITWVKGREISTRDDYALCRCGGSANKPFCDGSHASNGFAAEGIATVEPRATDYEGTDIVVHDDRALCMHAGFCGNRLTNVWKLVPETSESTRRAQVIAMVERCPSGALSYSLPSAADPTEPSPPVLEADLPTQVAVVPDGPLWVSGAVPIGTEAGERAPDRKRVTLCRCGASATKPFCDGTHKEIGFLSSP